MSLQTDNDLNPETLDNVGQPTNSETASQAQMSKKQLKKLAKHKKWIESKAERRKQERDKRKMKRAKLKESGMEVLSRNQIKAKLVKMCDSTCKVTIVIDCDYQSFMEEKELKKLCKQLNRLTQ